MADESSFTCLPDPAHGTFDLLGVNIPNGHALLYRSAQGTTQIIRDGDFTVSTGGFLKGDSEAPFGADVTYRLVLTVDDRLVQRNLVTNPSFETNTTGWATGTSRTLSRQVVTGAPVGGAVGSVSSSGAAILDVAHRTLLTTTPGQAWLPNTTYALRGWVRYATSGVPIWQDVVDTYATWSATIAAKATWNDLLGTAGVATYAGLNAALVDATGASTLIPEITVLGLPASKPQQWLYFQATLTTPASVPAGAKLALLHQSNLRELTVTWGFDGLYLSTGDAPGALSYIDGTTTVANPADGLFPPVDAGEWSANANGVPGGIRWEGTAHNSMSVYESPSMIMRDTLVCRIDGPPLDDTLASVLDCEPVFLTDPVAPVLGMWFGLLEIDDLTHAARQDRYDIIGRSPAIVVSQVRAWEGGMLRLLTATHYQRDRARALFAPGRILYLRNPRPQDYPESEWYIGIADVTEIRPMKPDHRRTERIWECEFLRVERPIGLIEGTTGITWADIQPPVFTSWYDVLQHRASWLALLTTTLPRTPTSGGTMFAATASLPTHSAATAYWSGGGGGSESGP
ncbi:MAG: hypothetical protein WCG47_04930 [Dermatophilaceae bacterium]